MRDFVFKMILIVCLLGVSELLYADNNLPKLVCYGKNDYNGGRQNWDIDIDKDGIVYFANTHGLLYNIYGEWRLKSMPKKGVVRAVHIEHDTIWCGGREYGYFVKKNGDLLYQSIESLEKQQVWDIVSHKNQVLFLTETDVVIYDKNQKTKKSYPFSPRVWSLARWNDKIWYVQKTGVIGYIDNGAYIKVSVFKELENQEVKKMFVHNNRLYLINQKGRLYSYNGKELKGIGLPKGIEDKALFCGVSYDKNSFCLGSVSNGLMRLNKERGLVNYVDSKEGLLDNTVLAIKKDGLGNLWLGLDYGIAKLELQGPINTIFKGAATYDIHDFKSQSFLATNKGLFYRSGKEHFRLMKKTEGQIWRLKEIDDQLFMCHNNGISEVKDDMVIPLLSSKGVYDIAKFGNENLYVVSTYDGLFLMKRENKEFKFVRGLERWGAKKIVYDESSNCIWVEFNEKSISKFTVALDGGVVEKSIPNIDVLYETDNGIFFGNDKSLFEYHKNKFVPSVNPLTKELNGTIQALAYSKKGFLAYIKNKEIKINVLLTDGHVYSYSTILKPLGKNSLAYFEYLDFNKDVLRIATDRGVTTFDLGYKKDLNNIHKPVISSLQVVNTKDESYDFPYGEHGVQLSKGNKDIKLRFAISKLKSDVVEYRYRFHPNQRNWSEWSVNNNEAYFSQIKGGKYTFYLQARVNGGSIEETILEISVEKYWYQTYWVVVPIVFVLLVFVLGVVGLTTYVSKRKLKEQKRVYNLKDVEKTLSLKNEQLLQYSEIISHKNEFLNKIKSGLEGMKNNESRRLINIITKEVNNEKKEFLFHKIFSEVHQDFITRITKEYPVLTQNDIRILSFIRTNLDKREICNLLNITPRSLDTNRYRLKKKLNLDHEVDLNQFIRDY